MNNISKEIANFGCHGNINFAQPTQVWCLHQREGHGQTIYCSSIKAFLGGGIKYLHNISLKQFWQNDFEILYDIRFVIYWGENISLFVNAY